MLNSLKQLRHKELFLYVFLTTFIVGTLTISIVTLILGHLPSFYVTSLSFIFGLYMIYRYLDSKSIDHISIMLLWAVAFIVFSHVIINGFNADIVYILLLPMAAPILLSRKQILFHGGLYLLISTILLTYGFLTDEFSDPRSISSFALLSIFVFLFGATYHYAIEESYRELDKSNKQKDFLLQEIHHRVKNNLNIVASILGLEKFESDTEEVHTLIDKNKLRIESIAMVHEILYESSDLEFIDFKMYVDKLSKHVLKTESVEDSVEIEIDMIELHLKIESLMHFGIIINELMTNSLKYAFCESRGKIKIRLCKNIDGYKFIYSDNGVGLQESAKGFGSNLVEMSVEQLGGELTLTDQNGVIYEISFCV